MQTEHLLQGFHFQFTQSEKWRNAAQQDLLKDSSMVQVAEYSVSLNTKHKWRLEIVIFKGPVHPQNQKYIVCFLPVAPLIHLDCFDGSCRVFDISAVEML